MSKYAVGLLALGLLMTSAPACSNPFGCDEVTEIIELEHDWMGTGGPSPLSEYALQYARERGECVQAGAIRNAAGREIGMRYSCTRCS